MGLGTFLPVVDDENNLVGALPRSLLHRMPIHQAVSVFLLNCDGSIYFQKRSLACRGFPGRYDVVGGHVKVYKEYLETAADEVASETPVRVDQSRFKRIHPTGDEAFFRLRTPYNSENKALFFVRLDKEEVEEFDRWTTELEKIWHCVALCVVKESGMNGATALTCLRERAHKDETRKTTELGASLQSLFQERIEGTDHNERRLWKMAREVEAYVRMSFPQAIQSYRQKKDEFADGFYSLIDPEKNLAPQAETYQTDILKAIESVCNNRMQHDQ